MYVLWIDFCLLKVLKISVIGLWILDMVQTLLMRKVFDLTVVVRFNVFFLLRPDYSNGFVLKSNWKGVFFRCLHGVWKPQKKYHSTLRAKRATFTFWMDKSSLKMPKMLILASFWKPKACGQTELPDRSVLIGQKLVENAKIQ